MHQKRRSKCLDGSVNKESGYTSVYTVEYYSTLKQEILSLATRWMNPEDIMLSEINQKQTENATWSLTCGI